MSIRFGIPGFLAMICLGWNSPGAAVPMPRGANADEVLVAAAGSPKEAHKTSQTESATNPLREEMKKRGLELENFVYEVFDPNAKDPLADLGRLEMAGAGKRRHLLWIAAGAAVLAGAGTAGYLWYNSLNAKTVYLDYNDGN